MELTIQIDSNEQYGLVVSSRVVAEELGKEHSDVKKKISECLNLKHEYFPVCYKYTSRGREYEGEEYLLNKDGFTLLVMNYQGYNDFKRAYINKFNEMEKSLQNPFSLPTTYKEALLELVKSVEEKEKLESDNKRLKIENKESERVIEVQKPKVEYYDEVLSYEGSMTTTQVAKSLGISSAMSLNKILKDLKVIYKVGGQWVLTAPYVGKEYTKEHIYADVKGLTHKNTQWTEKGKKFIYDLLVKLQYIKAS